MEEKIIAYVDSHREEMLRRWEILVNMDSGSLYKAGLDKTAAYLAELLEQGGFTVTVTSQAENGNIVIGRKQGAGKGSYLLVGHYDTVFAEGEAARRPFRMEDGKAYGPGVHDMKGGLVVMLTALAALENTGFDSYASICVLMNGDEEIGSPVSRPAIEAEAKKADAVFILEPARTDGSLVTARKGVGMFHLEVTGRAAHAGADPQAGVSAVEELARKIIELHDITNYETGTTVNVGVISGGTRSNVVAERAQADIDLRVFTKAEAERACRAIEVAADKVHLPGAVTRLTGGMNRPPMEKNEATASLLALVQEAGRKLGLGIKDVASGGASDGNFTAAAGAPTIDSMGTVGGLAHGVSEYSEVDSVFAKAKLLALTLVLAARRESSD
ncbi:MAG: M20 family metallopeptidase [bacterium]|jgi:glutamate carboxypeptidase